MARIGITKTANEITDDEEFIDRMKERYFDVDDLSSKKDPQAAFVKALKDEDDHNHPGIGIFEEFKTRPSLQKKFFNNLFKDKGLKWKEKRVKFTKRQDNTILRRANKGQNLADYARRIGKTPNAVHKRLARLKKKQ